MLRTRRSRRSSRGVTLFELLTVLSILSLTAGLSSAAVHTFARMTSLRAASQEVASVFSQARSRALHRNAYSGVKWIARDGDLSLEIHDDGDGDGVRNDDIESGVDPLVFGPISVKNRWPKVRVGFIPGFLGRDPKGNPVGDLSDPIRFGHSDIASFSPVGDCSPGSVWLGDGQDRQALVRLTPGSATIGIYEWVGARRTWLRTW
ncbi:MAG: prepilin-type N-terminal cleavage/methylation domain-containing protein [Holophagales bacterium]|nr:prepilin-type N-terminal cleavage/methylation domain-containing protein [Holophagales bacterium]